MCICVSSTICGGEGIYPKVQHQNNAGRCQCMFVCMYVCEYLNMYLYVYAYIHAFFVCFISYLNSLSLSLLSITHTLSLVVRFPTKNMQPPKIDIQIDDRKVKGFFPRILSKLGLSTKNDGNVCVRFVCTGAVQ